MRTSIITLTLLASAAPALPALAQSSPSNFTIGFRYDAERRLVGAISPDPDGAGPLRYAALRNTFSAAGRLIKVEKGELASWQGETIAPANWSGFTVLQTLGTAYDAVGRKVSESLSGGTMLSFTQISYDARGRLECTTVRMNPSSFSSAPASACTLGISGSEGPDRITKNSYDAGSQLTKSTVAVGTADQADDRTLTYTANGKLATLTDGENNRTTYEYDGFDRLSVTRFPVTTKGATASSSTDYEQSSYDANGNRIQFRNRAGEDISYSYDALDRVVLKNLPGAEPDVTYGYDLRGLQLSAAVAAGETVTSAYDNIGRLTASSSTIGGVTSTVARQYDANNNRTSIAHPDGVNFTYDYDGLDRQNVVRDSSGASLATFSYDTSGRRSLLSYANGTSSSYGYDGASRLTSLGIDLAGSAADQAITLTYNPAGQIISRTGSNDSYAYTAFGGGSSSSSANGLNQITQTGGVTLSYDARGNMTSDGVVSYAFSSENKLVSGGPATFGYDPFLRLVSIGGSGSQAGTLFTRDGDLLIGIKPAATSQQRQVFGPGTDELLLWYDPTQRFAHLDERGSVVAFSDASGSPFSVNRYDEYGRAASTNLGWLQYTGQQQMFDIPVYYYKARMYDSKLGRFLQVDPIGYDDQSNLYTYVANDPVNMRDPTGKEGACFYGPSQCGMVQLTPEQEEQRQETVSTLGTVALIGVSIAPVGRAAIGTLSWAGRAFGIGRAATAIERAQIAAASFKVVADKAGTTLHGVGEMVGWGGGRTAATQAVARTAEIDKAAVAGMREAGLTKPLATSARDLYRAAAATGRKGGDVAIERARLMDKVLRNW